VDFLFSNYSLVDIYVKGGSRSILRGIGRTWGLNLQVVKGQRAPLPTLMQTPMIGATK
jgi:hypothetical protein